MAGGVETVKQGRNGNGMAGKKFQKSGTKSFYTRKIKGETLNSTPFSAFWKVRDKQTGTGTLLLCSKEFALFHSKDRVNSFLTGGDIDNQQVCLAYFSKYLEFKLIGHAC